VAFAARIIQDFMRSAVLWVLVLAVVCLPTSAAAAQAFDELDFPIPQGQFFGEAIPNRTTNVGFAVQDGHGAGLWTAYQNAGAVTALGYPISRRFLLDDGIAQAFERGILRWNSTSGQADVITGRPVPNDARRPDRPPVVAAESEHQVWSGWWWPASDSSGPTLFALDGPLDKYDRYVALATGDVTGTRAWERENLYFPGNPWAGHCNGFAAAALLEPEPTEDMQALGITFTVADQKALLADYHFADAAAWSFGDNGQVSPADFHRMLLNWLDGAGKGFVLTYDLGGGEVWSYPVYQFQSQWAMDPAEPELWHVTTTVWMADMNVPPNFVGLRAYPSEAGKQFEYTLRGDPRAPSGGEWSGISRQGRFAQPGRIWYPEPRVRNAGRPLVSPGLDRETIANILAGD
jgi:hypothetical protein